MGMELPNSEYKREYVLLLKKNLYGLKQASANWYDMLKTALQLRGFTESVADPCVFIKGSVTSTPKNSENTNAPGINNARSGATSRVHRPVIEDFKCECKDIIVLTYVDDCIILSRDKFTI